MRMRKRGKAYAAARAAAQERVAARRVVSDAQKTLDDAFAQSIKCPGEHTLPHRVEGRGRCTLDECCGAEGSAHSVVHESHAMIEKEKAYITAYAEETERQLDARARMAV